MFASLFLNDLVKVWLRVFHQLWISTHACDYPFLQYSDIYFKNGMFAYTFIYMVSFNTNMTKMESIKESKSWFNRRKWEIDSTPIFMKMMRYTSSHRLINVLNNNSPHNQHIHNYFNLMIFYQLLRSFVRKAINLSENYEPVSIHEMSLISDLAFSSRIGLASFIYNVSSKSDVAGILMQKQQAPAQGVQLRRRCILHTEPSVRMSLYRRRSFGTELYHYVVV